MPDITITVTNAQAQRLATAMIARYGAPPEGVTNQQYVVQRTKALLKEIVKGYEAEASSNAAFDATRTQVDTDFTGF